MLTMICAWLEVFVPFVLIFCLHLVGSDLWNGDFSNRQFQCKFVDLGYLSFFSAENIMSDLSTLPYVSFEPVIDILECLHLLSFLPQSLSLWACDVVLALLVTGHGLCTNFGGPQHWGLSGLLCLNFSWDIWSCIFHGISLTAIFVLVMPALFDFLSLYKTPIGLHR